ncbi:peptidoglycan recognition family protein [Nocardiopsis changdeensis]|uniref:N-acetylmuramoyl-L-alanine amidase n=1 Tax=Nocardiopsis changdeensis TaxID=2831969 RepID=A0ABX8BL65_9ACTN|nr:MULTISPECIES: peptidoglycan recognition family protein [Nocardiopsis]QUX22970.1 N-acetylmuramoyl-L-alanine amidase [Nocardiopsis changdeensis]QYX38913.1 peptidoglycan recognition protein family protein [Nocardiopsis sp. MT53]
MPRPPLYISREDLGWSATSPAAYADPKSGLVVHYDGSDQGLVNGDLDDFLDYWQRTRDFHTGPSRNWRDVGYSFAATPQGHVVEGRGLHREQAAQPGGNTTHYSVTLGLGPGETPTDDQINAVRWLRQWLMEDHGVSGKVLGHRDFIATSCPGDRAYALVKDGTFTQAPGAISTEGDNPLIGLREGDGKATGKKEEVIAVQRLGTFAGFGSYLAPYGCDGEWGPATSEMMLALRHSVGSSVTNASSITGTAYAHLIQAVAIAEARKLIAGGGGGGALPATAEISGTVKLKGA